MATNGTTTPRDWVGRLIDRRFPLFEWLGSAESGDLFRTELPGPQTQKAAIRLVPADIEGAQAQFDDWAQAEGISHPHLLRIFESGHGRIDEKEFLYVVMELPEETLAQVLPGRALTASEANDLLPPVLDALSYLHAKGLVHGHITPSNIMMVGDRLKLSADTLQQTGRLRKLERGLRVYDSPEIAEGSISAASDVWSLGVTLVEALTQLPPMRGKSGGGDPLVPQFMPEPFAEIARKCLRRDPGQRPTLAEIEAIFRTPAVRSPSVPVAPPAAPPTPTAAAPAATNLPAAKPKSLEAAVPKSAQAAFAFDDVQPSRRALRSVEEDDSPRFRMSTPVVVGIVAVVLVLIAALVMRTHRPKAQPALETPSGSAATQPGSPAALPQGPPPAHASSHAQSAKGTVASRVMPEVPAKADQTIHGKITVKVRVWVDRDGAVYRSAVDFDGRSRYFSRLGQEAAKKWRFKPARAKGQPIASIWVLRFDFQRGKTDVSPSEVTP